jgi:hypothetical protein
LLLIAGGAAIAIGLSVLGYYGMRLIETLETEERHIVTPGSSIPITRNITTAQQGAYLVSFPEFSGGSLGITIRDPDDRVILQRSADPPIVMEAFSVIEDGPYTLTLTNPSADVVLEASVILDSQEAVLSRAGSLSPEITVIFGFVLVAGIATAITGGVITVMDRRRLGKMKQFGDTSDLV